MNDDPSYSPEPLLPEVVIARENAVFWMDGHGRWHNRHGRFEHKRIIDYFNRSIRRDRDGYYLTQVRGDIREKVYFPFEDTPLFVVDVIPADPMRLALNTAETIPLDPRNLFTQADRLYQQRGDDRIKFSDRALMAMAPHLEESAAGLAVRVGGRTYPIPEHPL